jgi:hypothetical protein
VSAVRSFLWVLPAVLSIGCANEMDRGPALRSDDDPSRSRSGEGNAKSPASSGSSPATANACESGGSWSAGRDFAIEADGDFARALRDLVRDGGASPIAVHSHMDPDCTWRVAFSAPAAGYAEGLAHATTFAPMMRHAAGLWTAAPQSSGWLSVVDRRGSSVWLPLEDATGSATYGGSSCASLSAVRVTATIPASAAEISFVTVDGPRTIRELMGTAPSSRGWNVRLAFSADMAR